MEKTISMPAVETALTVKELVSRLVEKDLQAWLAIPPRIRSLMLDRPADFTLGPPTLPDKPGNVPTISYHGVKFRYNPNQVVWAIDDIHVP